MNILGIDYGTKRIGLAWVQDGLDVVLPYGLIESEDRQKNMDDLIQLVKDENIEKLVIGLPYGEEKQENENTKRIRSFADDIIGRIGIHVEFVGEEFTTAEAKEMGGDASLDEKAAMLILQSYLAQ